MKCESCECELSLSESDDVNETFGVDYVGWCIPCASNEFTDNNLCPDDEEETE